MITAPALEIAVLVLGLAILLVEAFAKDLDKRTLALTGMIGLAGVLVATFFLSPGTAATATGFWSF